MPTEWKVVRLGDIASKPSYGMNAAAVKYDGRRRYIRITDIDENTSKYKPNPLTSPSGGLSKKYKLKENDLVFTRTGASTGKAYLYDKNDGNLYFAGFLIKFSITNAVPKYIFLQTLTERYKYWVSVISVRSGQPGINSEEYSRLSIPLPGMEEQERIVAVLEAWDEYLEKLDKKIELKKNIQKGLIQQLLTGKKRLPGFSGQWQEFALGEFIHEVCDKTSKHNEVAILTSSKSGLVRQGDYFKKQVTSKDNSGYKKIKRGEFTYRSMSDSRVFTFNRLNIVDVGAVSPAYSVFSIVGIEEIFISCLMKTNWFTHQAYRFAKGGTRLSLKLKDLAKVKINIPELKEQKAIAEVLFKSSQEIENLQQKRQLIANQKKYLLNKLISGDIRVPEDVTSKGARV